MIREADKGLLGVTSQLMCMVDAEVLLHLLQQYKVTCLIMMASLCLNNNNNNNNIKENAPMWYPVYY